MKLPFGCETLALLSWMHVQAFVSITSAKVRSGPGDGVVSVEAGPDHEMDEETRT